MRVRTCDQIRRHVIAAFQRDYPGEPLNGEAFSTYVLDMYCKLMETKEWYRYMIKTGREL